MLALAALLAGAVCGRAWHASPRHGRQASQLRLRMSTPPQELTSWSSSLLPRDGYKEGLPPQEREAASGLVLLDETNAPTVSVSVEELQAKWIDLCIEQSRPQDMDLFGLRAAVPLLLREDSLVVFTNRTAEAAAEEDGEVYVTEQELRRLWVEAAARGMGRPSDEFSVADALLLLPDEDDDALLGPGAGSGWVSPAPSSSSSSSSSSKSALPSAATGDGDGEGEGVGVGVGVEVGWDAAEGVAVLDDKTRYTVTEQELRRVWDERAEVAWGLPAAAFDAQLATLLLDDDDDEDESEGEHTSAIEAGESGEMALTAPIRYDLPHQPLPAEASALAAASDPASDSDSESESHSASASESESDSAASAASAEEEQDRELSAAILELHLELDDPSYVRPAWRKDRHILTPDIDTQRFEGDIMWSNTYMTQRVPANWNDPELEGMNDFYLASGSMAMPGEAETDFNARRPVWEVLGMPRDGVSAPRLALGPAAAAAAAAAAAGTAAGTAAGAGAGDAGAGAGAEAPVDWASFDFAAIDGPAGASGSASQTQLPAAQFVAALSVPAPTATAEIHAYLSALHGVRYPEEPEEDEPAVETLGVFTPPEAPAHAAKWRTPPEWLARPELLHLAGYDEWQHYDVNEFHGADDALWEEDLYYLRAAEHVLRVAGEFLVDHNAASRAADELRHWRRVAFDKLTGGQGERDERTGELREAVPVYLTPDKERGVEYSDEVIEMKSKMTLHVAMPPPAELFAGDTFVHNTEFETLNKIGTIREQYDWQPDPSLLPHSIDAAAAERLAPVTAFVNHCGRLQSTKGGVAVYEYFGQMRHVIGVRDMMLRLAKECWPEIKDLRLETERTSDKHDRSGLSESSPDRAATAELERQIREARDRLSRLP